MVLPRLVEMDFSEGIYMQIRGSMKRLSIFLAAAALLSGCEKEPPAPAAPPVVETVTVAEGPITEFISAVGEAKAYDEVNLVARVEGYLVNRNFTEGQKVKKGQLLYEIEPTLYEAGVRSAEAALEKARAAQKNAEIQYTRQDSLLKKDATSERAFDNAEAEKLQAAADVKACEAALTTAKQDLEYTRIQAPFDGWIGLSAYSVGNLVNRESGTLAKVVSTDPMRVEFVVSEMDILTMRDYRRTEKGRPDVRVRLFLQNGAAYPLDGKIDFWNNEINPNTGTLKLQAVFQNPERLLLPGMFVRIRIEPAAPGRKLLVPLTALMNDQAGDYVYVVGPDGVVNRRTIGTEFRDGGFAVVKSNLTPGEKVIVKGLQKVRPGMTVEPRESSDPAVMIPRGPAPAAENGAVRK